MSKTWTSNYTLNFWEKILYGILWSIVVLISHIPFSLLYLFSDALCLIIRLIGYRKNIIDKNLKNSFPEKTVEERRQIRNDFYHFFCDYIFETLKLATISRKEMLKRMNYIGIEKVTDSVKQGRQVALYLGHYCNWEWVTSISLFLPENAFGCQVYHVIESKVMDKLMLNLRSKMNSVNIPRAEVLRRFITEARNGKVTVCGFISDQAPIVNSMPYWVEFLNQQTPFINGTERLVRKFDMLPVYLDISRKKRGFYDIDVQVMTDNPKDTEEGEITQLYATALEKSIRRQPGLWLWSHNRWKRHKEEFFGH